MPKFYFMRLFALFLGIYLSFISVGYAEDNIAPHRSHGLAMYEDLKYPADFKHFDYVNPNAPKGGLVRLSATGTFDSLNPFIIKGLSASGLGTWFFETLTASSKDEPFSEYGLIAETIEIPADRAWVAYTLRDKARFHDGSPITVDDVMFSFEILKTKGHPFYRSYYNNVSEVIKVNDNTVKFVFNTNENRELPLIMGQLPILSKAYWEHRDFDKTTLDIPISSGPYKIATVDPGRSITYQRDPEYWGKDLPVNVGQYNFDQIRVDYYRDETVQLQAFKAGEYDFRAENSAKNWATAYDFPALTQGRVIKEDITHQIPTGMQGFIFNTRRDVFKDPKVREAISYLFDFEWANKNLFNGAYTRTHSYFSNSDLAVPLALPSEAELAILEPLREHIPSRVFTEIYQPPQTDSTGNIREQLRLAINLLKEAGWELKGGKLLNEKGQLLQFEILLVSPLFERIVLPFKRNLARVGIDVSVRTVDTTQYQNRVDNFDFDMIVHVFSQSLSPGNEQRNYWHSENANEVGSRNLAGIQNPAIDQLVDLVISAPNREELMVRTHALDRVLLWGHYVLPHWHVRTFRIAYWKPLTRPETIPPYDLAFDAWWLASK
jgi:microcin C transport system substrate-binding protein